MQKIEASIKFGIRPSALILGADSRKPWGKWDILLAEAYQILQDERCQQCGSPQYLCKTNDEHVQFRITEDDCAVMSEKSAWMDRWNKNKANKDKEAPRLRHEAWATDDRDLSEFREPYYEALLEARGGTPE